MLDTNLANKQREKITVVVTTRCLVKEDDATPGKIHEIGDEVTCIRKYGDVLVSIRRAVIKDSQDHKDWLERQKRKSAKPESKK